MFDNETEILSLQSDLRHMTLRCEAMTKKATDLAKQIDLNERYDYVRQLAKEVEELKAKQVVFDKAPDKATILSALDELSEFISDGYEEDFSASMFTCDWLKKLADSMESELCTCGGDHNPDCESNHGAGGGDV